MFELSDNEEQGSGNKDNKEKGKGSKGGAPFPSLEGQETAAQFVAKYKKACLNRRAIFNELVQKWGEQKPATGKTLGISFVFCALFGQGMKFY